VSATASSRSIRFTEEMKGHVAFGEHDFHDGRVRGHPLMFHLTIEAPDIDSFIADPRHEAEATGWVHCEALGGRRPVERGWFHLFVDTGRLEERHMLYRLHFADGVGHPLTLTGHKAMVTGSGFDMWPHTTTLYTRVLSGHTDAATDEAAEVVASGILRVQKLDFLRQLTTFRVSGSTPGRNIAGLLRFNALFLDHLRQMYAVGVGRRRAR
jgi:hypothetical protein